MKRYHRQKVSYNPFGVEAEMLFLVIIALALGLKLVCKRTRRETNKSELIGLAIEFLRQKSPAQIERLLRGRNPAS